MSQNNSNNNFEYIDFTYTDNKTEIICTAQYTNEKTGLVLNAVAKCDYIFFNPKVKAYGRVKYKLKKLLKANGVPTCLFD